MLFYCMLHHHKMNTIQSAYLLISLSLSASLAHFQFIYFLFFVFLFHFSFGCHKIFVMVHLQNIEAVECKTRTNEQANEYKHCTHLFWQRFVVVIVISSSFIWIVLYCIVLLCMVARECYGCSAISHQLSAEHVKWMWNGF